MLIPCKQTSSPKNQPDTKQNLRADLKTVFGNWMEEGVLWKRPNMYFCLKWRRITANITNRSCRSDRCSAEASSEAVRMNTWWMLTEAFEFFNLWFRSFHELFNDEQSKCQLPRAPLGKKVQIFPFPPQQNSFCKVTLNFWDVDSVYQEHIFPLASS